MAAKPTVVILGRPNVGKSSLFNRLVGQRQAITHEIAGTTRDRVKGSVNWHGYDFELIDTAGLEPSKHGELIRDAQEQIEQLTKEATVLLVVVDATTMIAPEDLKAIETARRSKKPTILVPNKVDAARSFIEEYTRYGIADIVAVSAIHGTRTGDLLDHVVKFLPKHRAKSAAVIKIALVGRPNVGKSSLFNQLAGGQAALVSPIGGTTRDVNTIQVAHGKSHYELHDTGGIRRSGQIEPGIEKFSFKRTEQAVAEADIGVVVMDATEPAVAVDQKIAGMIADNGKGLILLLNKWDQIDEADRARLERLMQRRFQFAWWAPLIEASALTGQNVTVILELAKQISVRRQKSITTSSLNRAFAGQSTSRGGQTIKLNYVTQTGANPPTFTFFMNHPKLIHFSFRRRLENILRENFDLGGTAIRLKMRSKWTKPNL